MKKSNEEIVIFGETCWSPKKIADAIEVSKGTVINWVNSAERDGSGIPFYKKGKGSRIWIPVEKFKKWYGYECQN